MDKAGLISKKFAVTLCSTGTSAIYIHPGEAAHGDLGVISKSDCMVAFSTSGKTREVIEMLGLSQHFGLLFDPSLYFIIGNKMPFIKFIIK